MKYKNTKTGAIIDSPFKILGKNWVEVEKNEKEGLQKAVEETKETVKKSSNVASRGGYVNLDKEFTLTFYTSLADENGGYAGMNAMGEQLQYGQVASNVFSFGTQIYLEGYGTFKVADRGGSAFNKSNRLDVFIPRKQDESDSQYKKRVNDMGIQKVRGKILK